jgi:hypothetical protein
MRSVEPGKTQDSSAMLGSLLGVPLEYHASEGSAREHNQVVALCVVAFLGTRRTARVVGAIRPENDVGEFSRI